MVPLLKDTQDEVQNTNNLSTKNAPRVNFPIVLIIIMFLTSDTLSTLGKVTRSSVDWHYVIVKAWVPGVYGI